MTRAPGSSRRERWLERTAFGASTANLVSIAVAHSLLGLGLVGLAWRPGKVRVPRAAWPLAALVLWTLVATLASDDPAAAFPQWKKFFVYAMLPLVYTALRSVDACRRAAEAWFAVGCGASLVAVAEFVGAAARAGRLDGEFYRQYVGDRVAGFYSHWMTFSQVSVLILLTLACYLAFGARRRGSGVWGAVGALVAVSMLLSFTRSAWLALLAGLVYVIANRGPRLLAAVPVLLAAGYLAAPAAVQQRVRSIRPAENQSLIVMWRTGFNMIADRPLLGVGPERAGPLFSMYQPEEVQELPTGFYGHLHSVYIHYAAERGIPAALIVLWLFGQVLIDMRRGLRGLPDRPDDRRFLLHAGACGTLAVAILSCFDVSLGDSEVLAAYLALVGIAYRGLPDTRDATMKVNP